MSSPRLYGGARARVGLVMDSGAAGSTGVGRQRTGLDLYLTVAAPIFFGLFFLEYPPLFLLGYWGWGGLVHKVLSGVFLILNLALAEFAVRRSRSKSKKIEGVDPTRERAGGGAEGEGEKIPGAG